MKVVHIESGLGNQMLSYCEYIAIKKMNPDDECYIETLVYDFPECNEFINQWNGYELNEIFGIDAPNVRDVFSAEDWKRIKNKIGEDRFWDHHWNWPVMFQEAFQSAGLKLKNARGNFDDEDLIAQNKASDETSMRHKVKNAKAHLILKYFKQAFLMKKLVNSLDYTADLFVKTDDDILTGQRLTFKNRNSGIERIENEIRECFIFPMIEDGNNEKALKYIKSVNSVAIHARRGDMLSINGYCYKNGYFKRAVRYIKKNVNDPVFLFFCDPGSSDWCRGNYKIFGLNPKKDTIHFVDWNSGKDSFRDMQLMAECKHNIITNSSFGWWSAWLNNNPNKITCSPDYRINTTHTF